MTDKTRWIASQLIKGESASNAASRLNTPLEIDNPTPQPQVSKPIDLVELRAEIPDIEAFRVLSSKLWDRITQALAIGDLVTVNNHILALLAGGVISEETVVKLAKYMLATIPDPNWQSKIMISPAQLAGYGLILVDEVQSIIDEVSND
jgi:hypothetical protein